MDARERFWAKVDKTETCWLWTGSISKCGYGKHWMDGAHQYAHRVSWTDANGPIPHGMQIDHICHEGRCVNPQHLRLATQGQNRQNPAGTRSDSKTGVRGVTWVPSRGKYMARATVDGKRVWLGYHSTIQSAEQAARQWRRENMPYSVMDHPALPEARRP